MTYKPRDGAESWTPNMVPPLSFSNKDHAAYQKRIDSIVGTRDGRSIIKLAWAPLEKRWRPHACGDEPPGYTFPIFIAYHDADGNEVAAPRWVLLERLEPEQFARMWEDQRYTIEEEKRWFDGVQWHTSGDGRLWDWKGPCPDERYVELWCHAFHDGICCPCIKYGLCECGEQYEHCWGRYLDPNDRLIDWITKASYGARNDPDVKPTADIRYFEAPEAQRELAKTLTDAQQESKEQAIRFNEHMLSHWNRKPVSTSGIILPN